MAMVVSLVFSLFLALASSALAGSEELLFREDWKESPPELPITQEHVANPDLILSLHGPGTFGVKKSHHDWIENDPFYVWSGSCPANWALSLRHRSRLLNLSSDAKIRWRTKQSGFRQLRMILKLSGGEWLVSDLYDGASPDWRVSEISIAEVRWRVLNIERVAEEAWVEAPDLTRIEEIGFTDLMAGGSTPASSRVDWIEVYGKWGPTQSR